MNFHCDVTQPDYSATTPLLVIRPEAIRVLSAPVNVVAFYQKRMSKAIWRPAAGRKLGFLVVQDELLLELICLVSPVKRLTARDKYLFPAASTKFKYGLALKEYMDMSVCVAAQPLAWYWNLGKLMAMIAPTLGDYVAARYPLDKFKGITTTSVYGGNKATQYTRIYKHLGETEGSGHEHFSETEYQRMISWLREHFPDRIPSARFSDGSTNARMARIAAYYRLSGDKKPEQGLFVHGHKRGVYFHAVVPPEQRNAVIQNWYARWGLPRYERMKNIQSPYQNGLAERAA